MSTHTPPTHADCPYCGNTHRLRDDGMAIDFAEHVSRCHDLTPPDNDDPPDEDWLRKIGFVDAEGGPDGDLVMEFGEKWFKMKLNWYTYSDAPPDLYLDRVILDSPTRGEIRWLV